MKRVRRDGMGRSKRSRAPGSPSDQQSTAGGDSATPAAEMAVLFPQLPAAAQQAYVALARIEVAGGQPTLEQLLATFNKKYRR